MAKANANAKSKEETLPVGERPAPAPAPPGSAERTVTLWACRGCGYFLSTAADRVLNCYLCRPRGRDDDAGEYPAGGGC